MMNVLIYNNVTEKHNTDSSDVYTSECLSRMVVDILDKAGDDFSGTWIMHPGLLAKALDGEYIPSVDEVLELRAAFLTAEDSVCCAANIGRVSFIRCKATKAVFECFDKALSYLFLNSRKVTIKGLAAIADIDKKYSSKEPDPRIILADFKRIEGYMNLSFMS